MSIKMYPLLETYSKSQLGFLSPSISKVGGSNWYSFYFDIDSSVIDTDLEDYPVLLHLSSLSGKNSYDVTNIFSILGSNSKKIKVTTDAEGLIQCYVEIDYWDESTNEAWIWIKIPLISSTSDTRIYVWYNNNSEDNATYIGNTGEEPATNVWDSDFLAVYHMNGVLDSTLNTNDLTDTSTSDAEGLIGKCRYFAGSDSNYLSITSSSFNLPNLFTVQCSYKGDGTQVSYATIHGKDNGYADRNWWAAFTLTTEYDWFRASYSENSTYIDVNTGISVVDDENWHTHSIRYDNTTLQQADIDVDLTNGKLTGLTNSLQGTDSVFSIGKSATTAGRYFKGWIDELRISSVRRDDSWIKADYYNWNDNFLTFGE